MSTFKEFSVILNSYQFDIIVVTWLQDPDYQHHYVQISGYNTVFKNSRFLGFYLKEQLQ